MTIALILKDKGRDVETVSSDTTLQDVVAILAAKKIGAVVVLKDGSVCGIASERDVVRDLAKHGTDALTSKVDACMTAKVVSCREEDTIDAVMEKMTEGRFRHMPVIESGELVGLISIGDVVKRKIQQAERDTEEMKRYIAG